jgi:uncharacterized BrkB/YihY/UPF0761 family membrane protein
MPTGSNIEVPSKGTSPEEPTLIKNLLFTILQFVLFLLAAFAGITLPIFHVLPSHITKLADGTRGFEWDGVLLMALLFILILVIEALRKRLRSAVPWTLLALVLAGIAEYAMKLGVRDL